MIAFDVHELDLPEAWVDGDATARWRSSQVFGASKGARALGSSYLEVEPGRRLARHVDSAEECVVVLDGEAEVEVDGETARVPAGGVAVVPRDVPHEVRNAGERTLRFLALYAAPEVTSSYEDPVQPAGERERPGAS